MAPPEELPAPDEEDDPELDPDEEEEPELEPEPDEELELDLPPEELDEPEEPDEPEELDPGRGAPELDEPDAPELEELELVEPELDPEELDPEDPELDAGGTPPELADWDPAPELEPSPGSPAGDPESTVSLAAEHPTATRIAPRAPIVFTRTIFIRMTLSTSDPTSTGAELQTRSPRTTAHKPRGGLAFALHTKRELGGPSWESARRVQFPTRREGDGCAVLEKVPSRHASIFPDQPDRS